jgi:predicted nucleic acid-binding Zn ribbon protein
MFPIQPVLPTASDETGQPRHCVECGKPIIHRRTTALYCSGKCRENHNAGKRRQARSEMKEAAQALCTPETMERAPETEA